VESPNQHQPAQTGGMSAENSGPPDRIAMLRVDLLDCHPPIWREIEVPMKAVICVTGDVRLDADLGP